MHSLGAVQFVQSNTKANKREKKKKKKKHHAETEMNQWNACKMRNIFDDDVEESKDSAIYVYFDKRISGTHTIWQYCQPFLIRS